MPDDGTPWAPSHYKPMSCACVHSDAVRCMEWRLNNIDTSYDPDSYDCQCECYCHERDLDEEENVW